MREDRHWSAMKTERQANGLPKRAELFVVSGRDGRCHRTVNKRCQTVDPRVVRAGHTPRIGAPEDSFQMGNEIDSTIE